MSIFGGDGDLIARNIRIYGEDRDFHLRGKDLTLQTRHDGDVSENLTYLDMEMDVPSSWISY